ncbi:hypothetical protein PV11_05547 [Exophiala sideris]|uniref:Uncharacterized protein n=1 Tax=Exophiala sideris TaxID=1016849 RepID=A0A0D1YL48_9EURO|nr:hypothetical protein PV11_05547 [Exophiala sideris]
MHFVHALISVAVIVSYASASNIPRKNLEARSNVDTCKAILIVLKASAFCSSFVPIRDVTSTTTQTGNSASTQVTVTAACANNGYNKKRGIIRYASRFINNVKSFLDNKQQLEIKLKNNHYSIDCSASMHHQGIAFWD